MSDLPDDLPNVGDESELSDAQWIEGLPTTPGNYWFYMTRPGYPSLCKVTQGRTGRMGSGELMHIADDFIYERDWDTPLKRIWHMRLNLPPPPSFDRTCPTCEGTTKYRWRPCSDCKGTGEI